MTVFPALSRPPRVEEKTARSLSKAAIFPLPLAPSFFFFLHVSGPRASVALQDAIRGHPVFPFSLARCRISYPSFFGDPYIKTRFLVYLSPISFQSEWAMCRSFPLVTEAGRKQPAHSPHIESLGRRIWFVSFFEPAARQDCTDVRKSLLEAPPLSAFDLFFSARCRPRGLIAFISSIRMKEEILSPFFSFYKITSLFSLIIVSVFSPDS